MKIEKIDESFTVEIRRTTKWIEDGQEYRVVDRRPYTPAEVAEMYPNERNKLDDQKRDIALKDLYGYVDVKKEIKEEAKVIYSQTLDVINIVAIIAAVNSVPPHVYNPSPIKEI